MNVDALFMGASLPVCRLSVYQPDTNPIRNKKISASEWNSDGAQFFPRRDNIYLNKIYFKTSKMSIIKANLSYNHRPEPFQNVEIALSNVAGDVNAIRSQRSPSRRQSWDRGVAHG